MKAIEPGCGCYVLVNQKWVAGYLYGYMNGFTFVCVPPEKKPIVVYQHQVSFDLGEL